MIPTCMFPNANQLHIHPSSSEHCDCLLFVSSVDLSAGDREPASSAEKKQITKVYVPIEAPQWIPRTQQQRVDQVVGDEDVQSGSERRLVSFL
mmetsp:Transcript_23966/g.55908  ORF Transcript_23966/g.55908 Transcript_23966/m.55908 type:complete len:93 (+) Transcript_23966:827-1105(+)